MKRRNGVHKLSEGYRSRIHELPAHIEKIGNAHGRRGKYDALINAVKAAPLNNAITYSIIDFETAFGSYSKTKIAGIRSKMLKSGIKHPRVVEDEGVIYIWENRVG